MRFWHQRREHGNLDERATRELFEESIRPNDGHRHDGTLRFDRKAGCSGFGDAEPPPLRPRPFGEHAQRLTSAQDFQGVLHGPKVFIPAVDRERAQVTQEHIHERVFEQLRFAHEKDRTRNRELHGEHIEVRDVVRSKDHRPLTREIFQSTHLHLHDRGEEHAQECDHGAALRRICKVISFFIARIRLS